LIVGLFATAAIVAACSLVRPSSDWSTSSPPPGRTPAGVSPIVTSTTKPPGPTARLALGGWIAGSPTISIREASRSPVNWTMESRSASGWFSLGILPDGWAPVTDGNVFANVLNPGEGNDVAILQSDGSSQALSLPDEGWVKPWRGVHGLVPLSGRSGFLLVGAAAVAIIDDRGTVTTSPAPDGYVALAPTSDPARVLLASVDDANAPGGLSASAPFAAYLWTIGSSSQPAILRQRIVGVLGSTIGLAWLLDDDGSWWSVTGAGSAERRSQPTRDSSVISPDGRRMVRVSNSPAGCDSATADPCSVGLVDELGSVSDFVGPSFGIAFDQDRVAILLGARPTLRLPWRLVFGPADRPSTIAIE
jgi:hypothetical protein